MPSATFTFIVQSPRYGSFVVVAPDKWRREILSRKWSVKHSPSKKPGRDFYLRTSIDKRSTKLSLHRFIATLEGWDLSLQVDHADGFPLNNGLDNLRSATPTQNQQNRGLRKNSTTGFIGVTRGRGGKFNARIRAGGKRVSLGWFSTAEEAAAARDKAAREMHGNFAVTNMVS